MNKADCFHLGYVAKLHGYKGEVSLFLDVTNPDDYATLDAVFIDINNQLTPFFISSFKLKNKGFAAVKFEGVDTENDSRLLLRKDIYLPASILPELDGLNFYDHEIVGFLVIDTVYDKIGTMESVIDLPANPLFQIMNGEVEILVPIREGVVKKVDRINKEIHIETPPGLVELYLG